MASKIGEWKMTVEGTAVRMGQNNRSYISVDEYGFFTLKLKTSEGATLRDEIGTSFGKPQTWRMNLCDKSAERAGFELEGGVFNSADVSQLPKWEGQDVG